MASLHGYYYAFFMAFTKVKKICFDFANLANVIRARFGDAKKSVFPCMLDCYKVIHITRCALFFSRFGSFGNFSFQLVFVMTF